LYIDNVQAVSDSVWYLNGAGDFGTAGNWVGGVPNAIGAGAFFPTTSTTTQTVNLTTAATLGTVRFNNANTYTLSGAGFAQAANFCRYGAD